MLNPRKTYTYFQSNWKLTSTSKNWHSFECPYCGKENKAAVHFDYEVVKCWSCNIKESIIDFVASYEGIPFKEALSILWSQKDSAIDFTSLESTPTVRTKSNITLPTGFTPILSGKGLLGDRARAYLEARNLDLKYLAKLGFGYCTEHDEDYLKDFFGYIVLPFKYATGELYYYVGRTFLDYDEKHKNPNVSDFGIGKSEILFNESALDRKVAVITEGSFCAVTMGKSGCASIGKDLSTNQVSKILQGSCESVIIAYDRGAYKDGIKAGMKLLKHKKVYVANLNTLPDGLKDPNESGKDLIMGIIEQTEQLTIEKALIELI